MIHKTTDEDRELAHLDGCMARGIDSETLESIPRGFGNAHIPPSAAYLEHRRRCRKADNWEAAFRLVSRYGVAGMIREVGEFYNLEVRDAV